MEITLSAILVIAAVATLYYKYRWLKPIIIYPMSISNKECGDNRLLFRLYNGMDRDIHVIEFSVEHRDGSFRKSIQYTPIGDQYTDSEGIIKLPAVITIKANCYSVVELKYIGEYADTYGLKIRMPYQRKGKYLNLEFINGRKQCVRYF